MTINNDNPLSPEDGAHKGSEGSGENLDRSQTLPHPEDPPGFVNNHDGEIEGTAAATIRSSADSPIGEQPTALVQESPIEEILVEVRIDPAITPPAGLSDALPEKVEEVDISATIVTPAALSSRPSGTTPVTRRAVASPPARTTPATTQKQTPPGAKKTGGQPPRNPRKNRKSNFDYGGCLVRVIIILLFVAVLGVVIAGIFLVYQYFSIAATLPNVEDIKGHASQFETTRFYDRNSQVIYEMIDPNAGRRTYTTLDKISPYVIAATIAIEDKEYYNHPGFDLFALVRALVTNYTSGEVVSGASTITQQLARTLFFTPEERVEVSVRRKAREIVLSSEITRRYTKDEILELYLNEINYGNMAYGIEAAAETYFNTTADQLTFSQSAFLAGLPQAPSVYDIFSNRDATLNRDKQVLTAMYNMSQEKGCIEVNNVAEPICVEAQQAADAYIEIENYPFTIRTNPLVYPHWVTYIRYLLETTYDPQTIYRSGFRVYTTLDPHLQLEADRIVKEQVEALAGQNATDGALVAIQPKTGEILAMTGSADFYNDAIAGQINMALQPRQPGSSIKPLTYAAAFEKGWTPATILWDVPSEFPPSGDPNDTREPYKPVNYDGRFHGPMSIRTALANSFNVPAVKALEFVGIYNNPATIEEDGLIAFAKRLGITTFTRPDYGLALTLGGGEVTLLELTSAYSAFANGGRRFPTYAISKIEDHQGKVVYEHKPPVGEQVVRAEHAYLISSILSDNDARSWMFGANSVLKLPFSAAVKTGTTTDMRDNLAVGYTPDIVTGVWVGNPDNTPMVNTTGLSGAAPIWSQFMQVAVQSLTGGKPTPFSRPAGVVERAVCAVSGTEPSEHCTNQRSEFFAFDQLPPSKDNDIWADIEIDTWTGLRASAACSEYTEDKLVLNVTEKWAVRWIKNTDAGRAWAEKNGFKSPVTFMPERECKVDDPRPLIVFSGLSEGQTITSPPCSTKASHSESRSEISPVR